MPKITALPLLVAATLAFAVSTHAANYYWDAGTVVVDGVSQGGTAAWTSGASGWEDGTSAQNWTDGNLAVFAGTGGTVTLGGAISASGLRFDSASGAYTLSAASRLVLTVGASGIDMSGATQNVTLNNLTVAVGGVSQTWNVASGRSLYLSATNTLNGQLTGTNAATITVTGGGLVDLLTNATGLGGYAGNWLIQGGSTLRSIRNNAAAFGSGTITLDGGTLAVGGFQGSGAQGNWTFNNAVVLGTGGVNIIDNQLPTGGTSVNNRYLKLDSVISGSGSLTFHNTQFANGIMTNDEYGYILTAASTFTGPMTVDANASVRIGGSAIGATDANAGNNGSISASVAITNNGTLRLTKNNAWTFANAVSGSGVLKIGGTVGTTTGQVVTLSGANSHTGGTTVVNGTLITANTAALGSGTVTVSAGVLQIGNGTVNAVTLGSGANLVLASGATLRLASTASAITLTGAGGYTLSGVLDLNSLFDGVTGSQNYTLISGGSGTQTGAFSGITGYNASLVSASFANGILTVTAVPEPAVFGLLAAGAPVAAALVRRNRRRKA